MQRCCLCKKKVCANRSYFKIPKDERRQNMWRQIYIIQGARRNNLMPNAVPFVQPLREKVCVSNSNESPLYDSGILSDDFNNNWPQDNHFDIPAINLNHNWAQDLNCDIPMELCFDVPKATIKYADAQTQTEVSFDVTHKTVASHTQTETVKYTVGQTQTDICGRCFNCGSLRHGCGSCKRCGPCGCGSYCVSDYPNQKYTCLPNKFSAQKLV